jgi:hypothetical protein
MKALVVALCMVSGLASAQNVRLDCRRVPAYTAELEQLLARAKSDPSIWRLPTGDALRTLGDRLTGNGAERAKIQQEQYEHYVSEIKAMMWTVREQCPGY